MVQKFSGFRMNKVTCSPQPFFFGTALHKTTQFIHFIILIPSVPSALWPCSLGGECLVLTDHSSATLCRGRTVNGRSGKVSGSLPILTILLWPHFLQGLDCLEKCFEICGYGIHLVYGVFGMSRSLVNYTCNKTLAIWLTHGVCWYITPWLA